jgi:hypothetical protein
MPTTLARWATAVVLEEMHDIHLQVPGFRAVRDQSASIATGSCFATCGEFGGENDGRLGLKEVLLWKTDQLSDNPS